MISKFFAILFFLFCQVHSLVSLKAAETLESANAQSEKSPLIRSIQRYTSSSSSTTEFSDEVSDISPPIQFPVQLDDDPMSHTPSQTPRSQPAEQVDPTVMAKKGDLFNITAEKVFNRRDNCLFKTFRWIGRLLGAMAVQGVIPMILFVDLALFNVSPGSLLDDLIVAGSMIYLLPPTIENFAQMAEDLVHWCSPPSTIPESYDLKKTNTYPSSSLQRENVMKYMRIPLNVLSQTYAVGMAVILTNVFFEIEHIKFPTFFWVFFVPYGISVYGKFAYFYYLSQADREYAYLHRSESHDKRHQRKIFKQWLSDFVKDVLPTLATIELRGLYSALREHSNSSTYRLQQLGIYLSKQGIPTLNHDNHGSRVNPQERQKAYHPSQYHPSQPTFKQTLAKESANFVFYGSLVGEFFLCQYGLGLVCNNLGIQGSTTQAAISYTGASLLNFVPFFFEGINISRYYEGLFQARSKNPYSASNPVLRSINSSAAFLSSFLVALSEVFPAWSAILSAENSTKYPLLVFMTLRHHARNAVYIQQGYDIAISNYHDRHCWRNKCCTCCKRSESRQGMIDYISKCVQKLSAFSDSLNADGISELLEILTKSQAPN